MYIHIYSNFLFYGISLCEKVCLCTCMRFFYFVLSHSDSFVFTTYSTHLRVIEFTGEANGPEAIRKWLVQQKTRGCLVHPAPDSLKGKHFWESHCNILALEKVCSYSCVCICGARVSSWGIQKRILDLRAGVPALKVQ